MRSLVVGILLLLSTVLTLAMEPETFPPEAPHMLYEPNAPDYKSSDAVQSLFDKLSPDPSLSTFMDVLTQVDSIMHIVNDSELSQPFTLFCPTNAAFRQSMTVAMKRDLETFLRHHLVPNKKLDPKALRHTQTLDTMLPGETVQVKHHFLSDKVTLDGVATVDVDHPITAANGVAYRINHVLSPAK